MEYKRITPKIADRVGTIVGKENLLVEDEDMEPYSHDETPGLKYPPEMVVKVKNVEQIRELMILCNREKVPVTPRGGGTGLTGGAVPIEGGIVLSFERMNRIKDIDTENFMCVLEPGVINGNLQRELAGFELSYPVNPASMDSCTIGGNVAESSSGANTVKYGGTKDYVCGLETVLPSSQILRMGGKLVKNATDYWLLQLLVGSEGILGIITEIILKVIPQPWVKIDLIIPLNELASIQEIIREVWKRKIIPASIEYVDRLTVEITREYVESSPSFPDASHYLLIGVDGFKEEQVMKDVESLGEICLDSGADDALLAQDRPSQEKLWKFRQSIREALLDFGCMMVEQDIVVPRNRITSYIEEIRRVCRDRNLTAGVFGHLGDGNVHLNFLKQEEERDDWKDQVERAVGELFKKAISLEGKISGEHGIGLIKKMYLPWVLNDAGLKMMRDIKLAFDPNIILNPGKIFDL